MPTKMETRSADRQNSGESIAVVGPRRSDALAAAARVRKARPGVRLLPMTLPEYLLRCGRPPMPVVLVGSDSGRPRDAEFLGAARARLLWRRPPGDAYDAISGLVTELPARRDLGRGRTAAAEPYLLLEGDVTAARARSALKSSVRHWIVEHVGRVRISDEGLAALAGRGVRWSVLWPVRIVAGVSPEKARRARGCTPSPR